MVCSQFNLRGGGFERSPNDVTVNTKGFCVDDLSVLVYYERVLNGIKERCPRRVRRDYVFLSVCIKHEKERYRPSVSVFGVCETFVIM